MDPRTMGPRQYGGLYKTTEKTEERSWGQGKPGLTQAPRRMQNAFQRAQDWLPG